MYLKYTSELNPPINKAPYNPEQTTYEEVLKAINQPKAIIAITRDLIVMHNRSAEILRQAKEAQVPAITAEAMELLEASSGPVTKLEILKDLLNAVYNNQANYREARFNTPEYLPEKIADILIDAYGVLLIEDLKLKELKEEAYRLQAFESLDKALTPAQSSVNTTQTKNDENEHEIFVRLSSSDFDSDSAESDSEADSESSSKPGKVTCIQNLCKRLKSKTP